MKQTLILLFDALFIAICLSSCNKDVSFETKSSVMLMVNVQVDHVTKTAVTDTGDGTYTPYWNVDDKLSLTRNVGRDRGNNLE